MYVNALRRLAPVFVLAAAVGACTAEVEEEGELPEVNVEGGDLPNVNVDPAEVNVSTDTQTVVTPDVDVGAPE
jgi:hypothetical protein